MIARCLAAVFALAVIARASVAAACSCGEVPAFVSGTSVTLGSDATLYLFVPTEAEPTVSPTITASQGDTPRLVEIEEVARVDGGSVKRIRIFGAAPGELSLEVLVGSIVQRKVDARPGSTWPHLLRAEYGGSVGPCDVTGPGLDLAGERAAAFRLRWTEAGKPREAYLPAGAIGDDDGIPIRGTQHVHFASAGCGVNWLGVDFTPLTVEGGSILLQGAVLTMLGVDGDEVEVLRGTITLRRDQVALGTFALRPPPPPPPEVVAAPPPVAGTKVVWWRVAAATGGGLTLGAAGVFLAIGRRRRAT